MTRTIIPAQAGFTIGGLMVIGWAVDEDMMAVPVTVDDSFMGRLIGPELPRMILPTTEEVRAPRPSKSTAQAPGAVGPYRIPFGGKTYKLVSFWQFDGDEGRFVFQMPPETPTPSDSRVQKVNREEFAKLKREGVPVVAWEVVNGTQTSPPEVEAAPPNTADPDMEFI